MTDSPTPYVNPFLKAYDIDKNAMDNGEWFDLVPGVRVKVAGIHSDQAREFRRQLEQKYARHQLRDGTWPEEIGKKMSLEQMAFQNMKDWSGVPDVEGREAVFTPEYAMTVFEKYPFFMDEIAGIIIKRDNFLKSMLGDGTKN